MAKGLQQNGDKATGETGQSPPAEDSNKKSVNDANRFLDSKEWEKFRPFIRTDDFGMVGLSPIDWKVRMKLAFGAIILLPIRIVLTLLCVILYFITCRLIWASRVFSKANTKESYCNHNDGSLNLSRWQQQMMASTGRFFCRTVLFIMGFYYIKKTTTAPKQATAGKPFAPYMAVVSNHVSYLDILYHMSDSFPSFVAKASVRKIPMIGFVSACMGCIYVQRESGSGGVSDIVRKRLDFRRDNYEDCPPLLVFPEGTTTNGEFLLPFRSGVFRGGHPVRPILLHYRWAHFSPAYESIYTGRHIFLLLCQLYNTLEVQELPVYEPPMTALEDPVGYAGAVRSSMALAVRGMAWDSVGQRGTAWGSVGERGKLGNRCTLRVGGGAALLVKIGACFKGNVGLCHVLHCLLCVLPRGLFFKGMMSFFIVLINCGRRLESETFVSPY
eukprot:jgi/Mesvir1/28146/Mv04713-RA.1